MEEEDGNAHEEEYSLGLKLAVIGLCEVDPDQRLTCDEVYMWLKPYKEKINNLMNKRSLIIFELNNGQIVLIFFANTKNIPTFASARQLFKSQK